MFSLVKTLTILLFAAATALIAGTQSCYGKQSEGETLKSSKFTNENKTLAPPEIVIIKGEHISQIFATVCAENTFAEYQAWALKNYFTLRQFDSPKYQISPTEIKDDNLLFSVRIEQNKWQAKIRDQKFEGQDPCEVAIAYLTTRAPRRADQLAQHEKSTRAARVAAHLNSLLRKLIPEARAEKLVNESTTINWLLGALATASVTDGPFLENILSKQTLPNTFMFASAFRAMNTANQSEAQTNFDNLLNQKYEILCSRNRAKIYGSILHVVIKKGYVPYRLGFEDNRTGKALKNENKILSQGKVHEHIVALGHRCNHDGDSDQINAQLKLERDSLAQKIARALEINRKISSESED